jgi:citronellyl-CoA dehydrogenase
VAKSPFYNADHEAFRDVVRRFVQKEIEPYAHEWDEAGTFPRELYRKAAEIGLLGLGFPEEYGGTPCDNFMWIVSVQELARAGAGGVSASLKSNSIGAPPIARAGTPEFKAKVLPEILSGEKISALAITEPSGGSDVANLRTSARREGDDYVINGGKLWITNGTQADWICLLANTSDSQVHRNKSLICVPMKSKGVNVARKLDKMGMRSSDTAQIFFEDVRVPKRNRIGEEGKGFTYQMVQFQEERLWGAAAGLKAHEYIIDETIEYTRNRKAFGQSILDNQVVHFRLAELQTEVELLRSLIYRAGEALVAGEDVTKLATMAKLRAGRLNRELNDACLQYWGGMGFMNETPVSRAYRDGRLTSIGGGADEVMLSILCKMMGTLPGAKPKMASKTTELK